MTLHVTPEYITSLKPNEIFEGMNHGQLLVDHQEEIVQRIYAYFENLSPTKPLLTSPLIRSKCLNTGGVGFKS